MRTSNMRIYALTAAFLALFCFCCGTALAGPLKFGFRNPSFGGPPLNGQWMLQSAKTQDPHGMLEEDSSGWQPEEKTSQEKLEEAFMRQLRYKLTHNTMGQMFNEDGNLKPGEYRMGEIGIQIEEAGNKLDITLDTSTGQTSITIPK